MVGKSICPRRRIIAPRIDYGWREHCGAGHKWTDRMSALGHKPTKRLLHRMSALPLKAVEIADIVDP
jgi:hypothetical protein